MPDFEATDRYMSGWVATCVHNGTRFYATDDLLYSDDIRRAAWRRYPSEADRLAEAAAGPGFPMVAEPVATVLSDIP